MKPTKYLLPLLILLVTLLQQTKAQTPVYTYFKIEIAGERDQLMELMNDQYKKEIFWNSENCYYVKRLAHQVELIQYDSDKTPVKFYISRNDTLFVNESYIYIDSNLDELSSDQQSQLKSFYQINKDIKKKIHDFDCFQVILKDPSGGNTNIEMYVTEALPNLPNHFPMSSNILNAEALEINMDFMGSKIKVEIIEFEKNVNIEQKLNINFNNVHVISNEAYIQMKSE
jgi:hypothetical protein